LAHVNAGWKCKKREARAYTIVFRNLNFILT